MRVLLAIVVLAGLGWSGFWFWNASLRERALAGWLEERRAAGWVAEAETRVTGFPNRVDAIVTLPLNKEALHAGGVEQPGHTEILAERCGVPDHAMMLWLDGLGVVHVTVQLLYGAGHLVVGRPEVLHLLDIELLEGAGC